jgi:hypothetical protein
MPDYDPQSRKLEQLLHELAELRARVTEQYRRAAEEREEIWATCAAARRTAAQAQEQAEAEDR